MPEWPRIRDLSKQEQEPFSKFLHGQTVPWVPGLEGKDQDFYYPWDYENWKRQPANRYFD